MTNNDYEFSEKIHSILLSPYLSKEELNDNCDVIKRYDIKNISTSLNYITYLKDNLNNNKTRINTLISYPFSDLPQNTIKGIVSYAKDSGAKGIEYVPKFFFLANNDDEKFANDIENILKSELPATIIFNKNNLKEEIFIKAIKICLELGIINYQFGDGFGSPISSKDLSLIKKLLKDKNSIKIVGGIKTLNHVVDLLDAGADCIGTSHIYEIFKTIRSK